MPFINGIGAPELIVILIIALIVVGPGRLPDVGSALGKSIREFRNAASDGKETTNVDPMLDASPTDPLMAGAIPVATVARTASAPSATIVRSTSDVAASDEAGQAARSVVAN